MKCDLCGVPVVEKEVTYTLEVDDQLMVIEFVPAKECIQCGDRLFSPDTVERLQQTIWSKQKPKRTIQTPVFTFGL